MVRNNTVRQFGSAAESLEEPIQPPVQVKYKQLLIDGQLVDAASGKEFPTIDPRTGDVITYVAEGDVEDVNRAVKAARKAFDQGPWPKMTAYERSCIMYRFADLAEKHSDEIAYLDAWDGGKPIEQARNIDVPVLARIMRYYAGWADKIHGLTVPADGPYNVHTLHEPIGVAGQIVPWNFPIPMFAWKIGPALACGNTVVLKTAEQTPLSTLYAAKLFYEIAFTGSTETGQSILQAASRSNLKPVTLELGGKSPFIVCEDANVDEAVEYAHVALFLNQGQCCAAGSRTFVHESIYDEFVEKARDRALRRVVGDPFRKEVEQGPQIDQEQFNKILRLINAGKEEGATLVAGGERIGNRGFYIQPTVFSDVKDDMTIAKYEIFGPVQTIFKFKTLDEVIQRANATHYGLAAGIFSNNIHTINTLSRALRVGTVWVNCYFVFDAAIPFGGYKMSGFGREKGIYCLQNYLQVKSVVSTLENPAWL